MFLLCLQYSKPTFATSLHGRAAGPDLEFCVFVLYDYKLLSIKDYDYSQLIENPKRYRFFSFEQMIFLFIGYLFYNNIRIKNVITVVNFSFLRSQSKSIVITH